MKEKIEDAKDYLKESEDKKKVAMKNFEEKLVNTPKEYTKIVRRTRQKVKRERRINTLKNRKKLKMTKRKEEVKRTDEEKKIKLPEKVVKYKDAEIFEVKTHEEEMKKETKKPNTEDIQAIGVELSEAERMVLSLPPKFAIIQY